MHPEVNVLWLKDATRTFPHAVFFGDTDTATEGWISFTAISGDEVVLASMTPEEWNTGAEGSRLTLMRVEEQLGRRDLVEIRLLRVDDDSGMGLTQAQRDSRKHRQSLLVYSTLSGAGESKIVREEPLATFQSSGGKLVVVPSNSSLERALER